MWWFGKIKWWGTEVKRTNWWKQNDERQTGKNDTEIKLKLDEIKLKKKLKMLNLMQLCLYASSHVLQMKEQINELTPTAIVILLDEIRRICKAISKLSIGYSVIQ